jgi:hypothetical protein
MQTNNLASSAHIPEHTLDLYALNRLGEVEVVAIEEHLLVCAQCRSNLELVDWIVQAVRAVDVRGTR